MADEELEAPAGEPKPKKKLFPILLIAGLMLVEGVVIFAAVKFLGGDPTAADAGEVQEGDGAEDAEPDSVDLAEITIAETDAFNSLSGRLYVYHIRVAAQVAKDDQDKTVKLIEEREATILDRINTVIRSADPKHLNEPGLETIRRQIKFELDKILQDDSLILELLVPKLLQTRASL